MNTQAMTQVQTFLGTIIAQCRHHRSQQYFKMRRTQRLHMNGMSASSISDTGQNRNSILNDVNNSSDNVSQRSIS